MRLQAPPQRTPAASAASDAEARGRFDVMVVDDEKLIADYIARVVLDLGTADVQVYSDPAAVLRDLEDRVPDLLITDYQMPGVNGVELIERLRSVYPSSLIPVIMVTADTQRSTRNAALAAGASEFLSKPIDRDEVRIRVRNMLALREGQRSAERRAEWLQAEVALATAEIMAREEETILSLARAMEYRDWETGGHIERMATYSRLIASEVDLGADLDPLCIYKAAPLHDVGKIGVPDHILLKPSSLSEDEFRWHPDRAPRSPPRRPRSPTRARCLRTAGRDQTRTRNEALDLFVYSAAALRILGPAVTERWRTSLRSRRASRWKRGYGVAASDRRALRERAGPNGETDVTECPLCGTPPRLQHVPDIANILKADADPDKVIQTYQCQVERRKNIYKNRVRHFRRAG